MGEGERTSARWARRVTEVDDVSFENLPTARLGLAGVSARNRAAAQARAERPPAPVRAKGTAAPTCEDGAFVPSRAPLEASTPEPLEASAPEPLEASGAAPIRASTQAPFRASAPMLAYLDTPAPVRADGSSVPSRARGTPAPPLDAPQPAPLEAAEPFPAEPISAAAIAAVSIAVTRTVPIAMFADLAPFLAHDAPTYADIQAPAIAESAPLDRDATERSLLAAIATGDEVSRLTYADWLEARGEHERASFLRVELLVSRMASGDPRHEACTRQLRDLVPHVDPDWRARVARPSIEGCRATTSRCPRRWDALTRTEREAVRYCGGCASNVYYFESVDEARDAALRGACVAIDLGAERWDDDLVDFGTQCARCARRVVTYARYCPHCGDLIRVTDTVATLDLELDEA